MENENFVVGILVSLWEEDLFFILFYVQYVDGGLPQEKIDWI